MSSIISPLFPEIILPKNAFSFALRRGIIDKNRLNGAENHAA
jgi:hypothetical protein